MSVMTRTELPVIGLVTDGRYSDCWSDDSFGGNSNGDFA